MYEIEYDGDIWVVKFDGDYLDDYSMLGEALDAILEHNDKIGGPK